MPGERRLESGLEKWLADGTSKIKSITRAKSTPDEMDSETRLDYYKTDNDNWSVRHVH